MTFAAFTEYRAKCKRWHPDLNPNDPTAEEHFKEVQAAYDAITKGETGPQMGGNPYGGYRQQSYGGSQQGYSQQNYGFDGFDGFDPFGFGFGFNGYSQQSGASYSGSDSPEMQAARNFVVNGRYAEARRVLDGMTARNARWYYLSSLANQGLGNSIDALQDARRAVQSWRCICRNSELLHEGYLIRSRFLLSCAEKPLLQFLCLISCLM